MENISMPKLKPYLKMKLVRENAILPTKRVEDGCFDIYGCFDEETFFLYPGDIKLVPLGFKTEFPHDWIFRIFERGSAGSKGLSMRCGVIDSGYRGEYFAAANNTSNKLIVITNLTEDEIKEKYAKEIENYEDKLTLYPQDKAIAQFALTYVPHIDIEEVQSLDMNTERGEGALGSSGK